MESDMDEPTESDGDESSQSRSQFISSAIYTWGRDIATGIFIVSIILFTLFLATGVWPPMQAVSSGSMEPHINQGDLVVVSDTDRFTRGLADENGVVTQSASLESGTLNFGSYGSVIVFETPHSDKLILHRAMFYVEEGENWYDDSYQEYLHNATSCDELRNCPAPNSGYITRGDSNGFFDQAIGISPPVHPNRIVSTANYRIPGLGWFQLLF